MGKAAAAAVLAPVSKPTRGVRPNFTGVPGELIKVSEVPADLTFSVRKLHTSPYDPLLRQLQDADPGHVLCFGDERARPSVIARAKKLSLKVEFADHAGKLYVRLIPSATAPAHEASVKTQVVQDKKTVNRALVMGQLRAGKVTPEAIAAGMRSEGASIDAPTVRSMLNAMKTEGTVRLAKITPETWELAV